MWDDRMTRLIMFAEDTPKLGRDYFTTIRNYKPVSIGETVEICTPKRHFLGKVTYLELNYIGNISTPVLLKDTLTKSREEALKLLEDYLGAPLGDDREVLIIGIEREVEEVMK